MAGYYEISDFCSALQYLLMEITSVEVSCGLAANLPAICDEILKSIGIFYVPIPCYTEKL
jgi:hypothetical protein